MSYLGSIDLSSISKMCFADAEVVKAYLGDVLLYDRGNVSPSLPYDAEIEYLQSSGTQYIDTLINGNSVKRFVFRGWCYGKVGINTQFLGSIVSNTNNFFGCRITNTTNFWYCTDANGSLGNNEHDSIIDATINSASSQTGILTDMVDGHSYQFISFGYTNFSFPSTNLLLFGGAPTRVSPNAGCCMLQLYTDNGLVRDFVPVRVGEVGYMYDKISGQLFGNSGSGDFILGNDKA